MRKKCIFYKSKQQHEIMAQPTERNHPIYLYYEFKVVLLCEKCGRVFCRRNKKKHTETTTCFNGSKNNNFLFSRWTLLHRDFNNYRIHCIQMIKLAKNELMLFFSLLSAVISRTIETQVMQLNLLERS